MRWLYSVMVKADQTGQPFTLRVGTGDASYLMATWGKLGNVETLETQGGCRFIQRRDLTPGNSSLVGATYSPQWGTFTSALTVEVSSSRGDAPHYLFLSGQGRIRTSATARSN